MSFLTVAGIDLRVVDKSGQESETERQGKFRRSFAGDGLSTERTPKRAFSAQCDFITLGDFDAFKALISVAGESGVATPVAVTSDADGLTRGASLTCFCWLGKADAVLYEDLGVKTVFWTAPLTIREQ